MMDERMHELLAEHDIRKVLMRYCRGVDRCDEALIASCFHDDALDDHGNWQARGPDIAPHIVGLVKPGGARAMHFMGNVTIEVEGVTAFAESYVLAFRAYERDGAAYTRTRAVRFVDRFSLRSNEWRISERVVVDDWNRVDQVEEAQDGSDQFLYSRKDKEDPVYRIRVEQVARTASDSDRS
jgi:hypothetical protein